MQIHHVANPADRRSERRLIEIRLYALQQAFDASTKRINNTPGIEKQDEGAGAL